MNVKCKGPSKRENVFILNVTLNVILKLAGKIKLTRS